MKKQTSEEFIEKSKSIFNNLDYSKVNYINSRTPVILRCKIHGEFSITPKDHICYERGCQICSGSKYNTLSFINRAKSIHGDKFLYDKVCFKNIKVPVIITCKIHGDFRQVPDKHINAAQGCPKCKKSARKDLQYFIKMGTIIHNGKYDYSKSIFTTMFSKITIICPKHGEFNQTPTNHINNKQNCPACMVGKSKKENDWLDFIGIPNDFSHRSVILHVDGRRFIVDGFNSLTNTVYEFYGDFWHGNPLIYNANDMNDSIHVEFGKLYDKTIEREKILQKNGYNIVSIWENDFDKLNNIKLLTLKNRNYIGQILR